MYFESNHEMFHLLYKIAIQFVHHLSRMINKIIYSFEIGFVQRGKHKRGDKSKWFNVLHQFNAIKLHVTEVVILVLLSCFFLLI